jgi:polyisoprenoid-binding protein YceI
MRRHFLTFALITFALFFIGAATPRGVEWASSAPLSIDSGRVVINGTSNIHAYTAESLAVRLVNAKVAIAPVAASFWTDVVKPGELQAFEIAVRADSLHSPKDGLDKNMHKALKADEHPDITFRLLRLDATAAGAAKAIGVLRVAGVAREVTLDLTLARRDAALVVTGQTQFLMTDFGITPPKAMLGMLKTDPKVTINFETVLSIPAL